MSKKLTLSTQILRTLSGSDLDGIAGGATAGGVPVPPRKSVQLTCTVVDQRPVPRPYSQWNSCGIVCMAGPCD